MPRISLRANATPASPIRKFLPLARAAERRGVKVLALSSGDPDYAVPAAFFSAIARFPKKSLGYAPSSGLAEHAAAWQAYYAGLKIRLKPENILPTAGCAEAILFALLAAADPGDEVLVFEPVYVSYKSFAAMAGIKLVPVRLEAENGYCLPKLSVLENKLTARTRAIVVVNPDNPTGKLWQPKELAAVLGFAKKHDLFVIADETYREIRFSGRPECLLAYSEYSDRIILVDSVSKRFTLPGARIGCLASFNSEVMAAALRFAQARLSVGTLEQLGTVPLLRNAKKITAQAKKEYRARCEAVARGLENIPGVSFQKPGGAFYMIARLPVLDAEDFVRFLLEDFSYQNRTLLLAPMREFYLSPGLGRDEVRIACVLKIRDLKTAMQVLAKGLEAYKQAIGS